MSLTPEEAPPRVVLCPVVGLRAESAEALASEWLKRSINCTFRAAEADAEGRNDLRLANEVRSATYLLCADELRRQAGLPIPRQPEPNIAGLPRAGNASAPTPSTQSNP